jgi:hypothetical protein
MPPIHKTGAADLGWKAFFSLLAIMQVVALGVMWRTYDAVTNTAQKQFLLQYKVDEVQGPAIRDLQGQMAEIKRKGP